MDRGHAELCVGVIAQSLPPQCGGPRITNWEWADHDASDFEQVGDVRWGEFEISGTFDGTEFTVGQAIPASRWHGRDPSSEPDLTTPCPPPAGGWRVLDPALTSDETLDRTLARAERLDGYADAWVDQSINPAYPFDDQNSENAANDPTRLVLNVRVTRDAAAAETTLRRTWGGALCVSGARHTAVELRHIQDDLSNLPGMLSTGPSNDVVDVEVVYDDGSLQAWADQEYGAGTVRVTSALVAR
ncbi:MAG: hypothetical protein ACR2K3_10630 [Nocardioides sp.]